MEDCVVLRKRCQTEEQWNQATWSSQVTLCPPLANTTTYLLAPPKTNDIETKVSDPELTRGPVGFKRNDLSC